MDSYSRRPRSSTVAWLDAPETPPDPVLADLNSALAANPTIVEAWLVRQRVTPTGEDPHEQLSIALYFDDGKEPSGQAAEIVVGLMQRPALEPLGVRSAIIVNDGIRAKTERHGVKVYTRPSR